MRRETIVPTSELYAFWKQDTFPWVLGGPVTRVDGNGNVETSNFGGGYWFTPIKLLPRAQGASLHEALKQLAVERQNAVKEALAPIDKAINKKLADLAPFAVQPK